MTTKRERAGVYKITTNGETYNVWQVTCIESKDLDHYMWWIAQQADPKKMTSEPVCICRTLATTKELLKTL
jgi:hypothetical protein